MKNEKGITLVALVITIIVLLILAGVSLSLIAGENGVANRAMSAKIKTEKSEILEQLRLKIYEKALDIENDMSDMEYLEENGIVTGESKIVAILGRYASTNGIMSLASERSYDNSRERFVVHVLTLKPNSSTGHGDLYEGDVYYIFTGDLYYMTKDKKVEFLGPVVDTSSHSTSEDIYEYDPTDDKTITGIKREYSRTVKVDRWGPYETTIIVSDEEITKVTVPSNVVGIKEYVFDECSSLIVVNIPKSVAYIADNAFPSTVTLIFPEGINPELEVPANNWGAKAIVELSE